MQSLLQGLDGANVMKAATRWLCGSHLKEMEISLQGETFPMALKAGSLGLEAITVTYIGHEPRSLSARAF